MTDFSGQIAVVTGASSGIGRAIAFRFAQAGARVALVARREERLNEIHREITAKGQKALVVKVDLTVSGELKGAFAQVREVWGEPEILVNNAGRGCYGPVTGMKEEEYDAVFNLNVRALMLATREVLPAMIKKKSGTIINISSIAGKRGLANVSVYCASKFAVSGFSEALLEEVREHNIRVSTICPGLTDTEFFGLHRRPEQAERFSRYIQADDIADAALLCAQNTSSATYAEVVVRPRLPV